ncbi:MAG: AsmA family protein, partial [Lysobacterales bacterium]
MLKRLRNLLVVAAILALVPAAIAAFMASFDWNRAKPWLQTRVGAAIGRDVAITGELRANWSWRDAEGAWSPGLRFAAADVQVGNPDWAKAKHFAELGAIDVDLRLLPLLRHRISIPSVRLVRPSLDLERRKDDRDNWTFAPAAPDAAPAWTFEFGEIEFDAGDVTIADAERGLDVHAEITALDAPIPFGQRVQGDDPSTRREVVQRVGRVAAQRLREAAEKREARAGPRLRKEPLPYLFAWKAKGTLQGERVEGEGRFGGVLALQNPDRPFPVRADIDVGATEIALTGTITDPASPDAIDMRLWISGRNLAQLYPIAGLVLPNTPPYATVGRLSGRFHPHRSRLRYEDFSARVGGSDLAGTLTYRSGVPRPTLTGNVDSTLLQFEDLGVLVGADTTRSGAGDASPKRAGKVLPAEPFEADRWRQMDADVHFSGKRVVRTVELPIRDVDTRIVMKDAVLTLDPLRFGMAGGNVRASLRVDGKPRPPRASVALDLRKLQLRRLFEKVDGLSTSLGEVNGTIELAGSGPSVATLLGSSDGSLKLLMTDGRISEVLMEKAALNLANVVLAKLAGDRQVGIDCAAADFTAKHGVLTANLFVFDTENALIDIDGRISLADEKVDLTLHPHTKGPRILSLRSPLHVTGTFEHIDVGIDKKSLFARGGAAIGLGLIAAPLIALLPTTALSDDARRSCAPLVAQVKQAAAHKTADAAPAAAKHSRSGTKR